LERMVHFAGEQPLNRDHLPPEIYTKPVRKSVWENCGQDLHVDCSDAKNKNKQLLADLEREEIIFRLKTNHNNVSQVAREMGFSRRTIHRKIIKYGIEY